MKACIDLSSLKYKVEYEESYLAEKTMFRKNEANWLKVVPCANGHIFPWSETHLAYSHNARLRQGRWLVVQDGEDGTTFIFPLEDLPKVAKIVKPKRKRKGDIFKLRKR